MTRTSPTSSRRQGAQGPKLRRTVLAIVIAAFAALFIYFGVRPDGLSDKDQIYNILEEIRGGVARQDDGQVFAHISRDSAISVMTRREARLQLIQWFRQYSSTAIVFKDPDLAISGSEANLVVVADVTGSIGTGAPASIYHGKVVIALEKTTVRRFLIFPHPVWKIVKVTPQNIPEL